MSRFSTTVVLCVWTSAAFAENVVFPPDAGVVDVTTYGAVPNDGRDDTRAIQKALADHPTGNHLFYLPNGVYDVSDVLMRLPEDDPDRNTRACIELRGSKKRNILQGQSELGTILRLADSVPAAFDGAVLNFGQAPAQRFRNAIRNMTVSIGTGHPKATGVQFNASNQGTVHGVTIKTEDPGRAGSVGLDMRHTDEIGPLLVEHLTVEGFDYGVRTAWQTASQTFEHVTLRDQRRFGWQNGFSQRVFVRKLTSRNAVPAFANVPGGGRDPGQGGVVLLDSELVGVGEEAIKQAAVRNHKSAYLRNVRGPGYGRVVSREMTAYRGNAGPDGAEVEEYWANGVADRRRGGAFSLFPSPDRTLRLPVEETPEVAWEADLARWSGPHRFAEGGPGDGPGHPDDAIDDTVAVQRAIDSGVTTVYLPRGTWRVGGTLVLRGNVRRLLGCESRMVGPRDGGPGIVRVGDGTADVVVVERLESGGIRYEQATGRTLVLKNLLGGSYATPKDVERPGPLFVADVVFGPSVFRGQRVWARQYDTEGDTEADPDVAAKIVNDGGALWILGLKTEDAGTVVRTTAGGRSEILGAIHVGAAGEEPRFEVVDSAFSAAGVYGGAFRSVLSETRDGETRVATAKDIAQADVISAFPASAIPDEVVLDTESPTGVEIVGEWRLTADYPSGFLGRGFHTTKAAPGSEAAVVFTPNLPAAGEYEVALRWTPQRSGFGLAKSVPVTIDHADGTAETTVDQSQGAARWNPVGTFRFEKGIAKITLSANTRGGNVAADALRLRRVPKGR